jgi:tRNA nucleotidyltransferase (CCA-adding enzyme)
MIIPDYVSKIIDTLVTNNHKAYLVGGCVRDSLVGLSPSDYDICTDATPSEVIDLFSDQILIKDNIRNGDVAILDSLKRKVDVTTFRKEGKYSDRRHPDTIEFVKDINEDLSRRDFTINALACDKDGNITDLYGGMDDLRKKVIRCIGDPNVRFKEDPLRILRAFRFAAKLDFLIDPLVLKGIRKNAYLLKKISYERVIAELGGIMLYDPGLIEAMHDNNVLKYILPSIERLFKVEQNTKWHYTDVGHHTVDALRYSKKFQTQLPKCDLIMVRFALLFHDTGKFSTKTTDTQGHDHFYGHPEISYQIAKEDLEKLGFPLLNCGSLDTVLKLIRYHDITIYPKRKLLLTIIDEYHLSYDEFVLLGIVRECDIAAHVKIASDDRLERYNEMLNMYKQKINTDKILSEKDLAITGDDIMRILYLQPGKLVGEIKKDLFHLVFLNPSMNDKETLIDYLTETYNKTEE